jgi:hypothetical protein
MRHNCYPCSKVQQLLRTATVFLRVVIVTGVMLRFECQSLQSL